MNKPSTFSVLIFYPFSPKKRNGVQRFTNELLASLNTEDATVYSLFWFRENGIFISYLKMVWNFLHLIMRVNTVHFVVLTPYNIPFIFISRLCRRRIITTYHGNYVLETPVSKKPHIFIPFWIADKLSRLMSSLIVSPSKFLLKELNVNCKNCKVIPNPCNISYKEGSYELLRNAAENEIALVTATNFNIQEKSRALGILLEVVASNPLKFSCLRIYIFGDGKHLNEFKDKYSGLENLRFMGFDDKFRHILSGAHIYAHISGLDNQPYSVIDALLNGKVILYNRNEGISEMLDQENNFVVNLEIESITDALEMILHEIRFNYQDIVQKGSKNRENARLKFSAEVISREYLDVYQSD